MIVGAEVGLYVPVVLVAFAVFLGLVVRARPRRRGRLEEGGGQRVDDEG